VLLLHNFQTSAANKIVFGDRELSSHTDSDSENKSNKCSDSESCGAEVNDQNHEDHSQRHGNSFAIHFFSLCT